MNVYSTKQEFEEAQRLDQIWTWLTGAAARPAFRARAGQEREADSLGPFAEQPYGPQMIRNDDRTKDLTDAIAAVRKTLSLKDQQRLDKVAFAIAKLGTGRDPVDYAGVKENDMLFSASLLKLTLLFASFELVARINSLSPVFIPGRDVNEFWRNVEWAFGKDIASAVPTLPAGDWNKVKFGEALTASPGGSGVFRVKLSPKHLADLEQMVITQDQDWAARNCMDRLGYSYVNGALAKGGFFDPKTNKGIWYANDLGGVWKLHQFYVPVATVGRSSVATTALAMARLLTAMHTGTLVDQDGSREMMRIMSRGGAWLFFTKSPVAFTNLGAKVGHHPSADANVSTVKSEGAFLEHNGSPFVAVWQNYPDASPNSHADTIHVYRVIDHVLKNWP